MEALKILIVEDEFSTALEVEEQLLDFGYMITDNVRNSDDALRAFRKRIPDMVILDIGLNGSEMDGIELAHQFNTLERVPIIYLTAYGDKATVARAKSTRPAYYLVKPANKNQLEVALDFAIFNFSEKKEAQIDHSLSYHAPILNQLEMIDDFFFVKRNNRYVRINIAQVLWVEALDNAVKIVTEQRNYTFTVNLKKFSNQIKHPNLLRVHRSFSVNIDHIKEFDHSIIIMQNGEKVNIGKQYKKIIFDRLNRLHS